MPVNFVIPYTNKSPQRLAAVQLPTTNTNLFTAPSNAKYSEVTVIFANTTSSPVTVNLISNGRYLIRAKEVPAFDSLILPLGIVIDAGYTITGFASTANAVDCSIFGNEVT